MIYNICNLMLYFLNCDYDLQHLFLSLSVVSIVKTYNTSLAVVAASLEKEMRYLIIGLLNFLLIEGKIPQRRFRIYKAFMFVLLACV